MKHTHTIYFFEVGKDIFKVVYTANKNGDIDSLSLYRNGKLKEDRKIDCDAGKALALVTIDNFLRSSEKKSKI